MPQCRGKTKQGKRCTRPVAEGDWCHDHGPKNFDEVDEAGFATQAAFARIIDRSAERVRQYREQGMLSLEKSPVDGKMKLHVERSLEALVLHSDISRSSLPFELYEKNIGPLEAGADADGEEDDLRHQKLVAEVNLKVQQARKAKLKADEIEEKLVPAEDVRRAWFTVARQTRDKLMSVPDRLSAQLAGMTDEHAIFDELTREIRQALADLDEDLDGIRPA